VSAGFCCFLCGRSDEQFDQEAGAARIDTAHWTFMRHDCLTAPRTSQQYNSLHSNRPLMAICNSAGLVLLAKSIWSLQGSMIDTVMQLATLLASSRSPQHLRAGACAKPTA